MAEGPESPATAAPPEPVPSATVRVVARIVDPSVRQDGRGDPELVMRTASGAELAGAAFDVPGAGSVVAAWPGRPSHPVRDKLLAKARAAALAAVPGSAEQAPAPAQSTAPAAHPREQVGDEARLEPDVAADGFLGFAALPPLADD